MKSLRIVRQILQVLSHALAERIVRAWRAAAHREKKLRIGVDIRPFYEPLTGIGWYLYHLLHEIAKRDDVELLLFGDARVTDFGPRLHADLPPTARICWFDLRGRGRIGRAERALTAAAYVLMQELRLRAARTACARAQVTTLRERLLKLGVHVLGSVRRIVLHLPTSTPFLDAWRHIALALGARPG